MDKHPEPTPSPRHARRAPAEPADGTVLRCHLITPRAERWLAEMREPRILHLFDGICNLVSESGHVISLVSNWMDAAPFSMVLDGAPAPQGEPGIAVSIDFARQRLHLGSQYVFFSHPRSWQPRPDWRQLRSSPAIAYRPMRTLPKTVSRPLELLLDAICQDDELAGRQATAHLAGYGQGLTPSGDDVLVGLLYALRTWRPGTRWPLLISEVATPLTTSLSAAFLRAAAAGEASAPWHRLIAGAADGLSAILATGHTSGVEAWAAFVRSSIRLRNDHQHPIARSVNG